MLEGIDLQELSKFNIKSKEKRKELEVTDTTTSKFIEYRKDIKESEYKKHINEYIVLRYKEEENELEIITKLLNVTKDYIEILIKEDKTKISFDKVEEAEFLKLNDVVTDQLEKLNTKEKIYLANITNIYDEKINCLFTYHGEVSNLLETEINYKMSLDTTTALGKLKYNASLIKNIEVLDEYNLKNAVKIMKLTASYFKTDLESILKTETVDEKNQYAKLIIALYLIGDLTEDVICYLLCVNREFINFITSTSYMYKKPETKEINEKAIYEFLKNNEDMYMIKG